MEEINNKFDKVEKLINEMYQKHYNHNYLSYFICYIFNYKRWFIMKKVEIEYLIRKRSYKV